MKKANRALKKLQWLGFLKLASIMLLLGGCSQLTVREQMTQLNTVQPDGDFQFIELPFGMQGDPELEDGVIELPAGRSFYKGYKLPSGHSRLVVQLRTYITKTEIGEGFFYPVIEMYSKQGVLLEIKKPQLRFTQLSSSGRYAAVPLEFNRDVASFVIRTEPKLYGEDASYTTQHQGSSWSYSVTPFSKRKAASYLPLGTLELLTPDEGFNQPFEKMSGPYWQFSMGRGEKSLAPAEDYLPNLTLGGGPSLTFGYSWAVSGRPSSSIRSSLGLGYYALSSTGNSTHTQSYLMSDLLWVESNQISSLAFGFTARGLHEYKGAGEAKEYESTFGPKVAVEIRGSMGVSLGAYMSWLTFTDQDGNEFDGNQIGMYLMRLY